MIKRLVLTGVALASLAVTSLVNASPASADSTISIWNSDHVIEYGYGHFASDGEIFTACDTFADGKGISVNWYVVANPANHGEAYDNNGADNGCAVSNATITERRDVVYRVCRRDNGAYVFCSEYFHDRA
jgi:hypothetical protein